MVETDKFNRRVEALELLLREKLGVRGRSLSQRLRRAGRRLPKRVRRSGLVITEAQQRSGHPRLARLNDPVALRSAFAEISAHLDTIDPADRRKGIILGVLGGIVFNLLVLIVAITLFLYWKGIV